MILDSGDYAFGSYAVGCTTDRAEYSFSYSA